MSRHVHHGLRAIPGEEVWDEFPEELSDHLQTNGMDESEELSDHLQTNSMYESEELSDHLQTNGTNYKKSCHITYKPTVWTNKKSCQITYKPTVGTNKKSYDSKERSPTNQWYGLIRRVVRWHWKPMVCMSQKSCQITYKPTVETIISYDGSFSADLAPAFHIFCWGIRVRILAISDTDPD